MVSVRERMRMKLEELLGEELYAQVQAKLDEVNGKEPDKLKHVRYADLSEGGYVSKAKHDALQASLTGKETELTTANELIAELKKGTKSSEELQGKITDYETQVAQLQKQLAETQVKAALKVALLSEKALDIDYLAYKVDEKLKGQGRELELDANGAVKGLDDLLAGLKTQFPTQFEAGSNQKVEPIPLPKPDGRKSEPASLEEALRMQYEDKT